FQAEDGIRDRNVTGVQTCALPIYDAESTEVVASFLYFKGRTRTVSEIRDVHLLVCTILHDVFHAIDRLAFLMVLIDIAKEFITVFCPYDDVNPRYIYDFFGSCLCLAPCHTDTSVRVLPDRSPYDLPALLVSGVGDCAGVDHENIRILIEINTAVSIIFENLPHCFCFIMVHFTS